MNFEHSRSPFAALMDALRDILRDRTDTLPTAPNDRDSLLGMLGQPGYDPPVSLDKRRLFVSISESLARLAQRSPWLLTIDDAQWADPETLEFIAFLAPRITRLDACIIIAHRPERDDHGDPLAILTRIAGAQRIELQPLTQIESRLLIAVTRENQHLAQDVVDDIVARADGNPLFIEELSRGALRTRQTDISAIGVMMRNRTKRLDLSARRILEFASVLGRRFDPSMVARLGECDVSIVLDALRLARDEGLIEEQDGFARAFVFRHELLRRAFYDGLLISQRQTLHRRIAEMLEQDPSATHDVIARHRLSSGDLAAGAASAEAAGDDAMAIDAIASARDRYLDAERTDTLRAEDLARLYEKLGRALDLLGDSERAALRLRSAADAHEASGRDERAAFAWVRFALVAHRAGNVSDAITACGRALNLSADPSLQFSARSLRAQLLAMTGDSTAAEEDLQLAKVLAGAQDARAQVDFYNAQLTLARFETGDAWMPPAEAAIAQAEITGDPGLTAHALINFGVVAAEHGRVNEGVDALTRAIELADRNGRLLAAAFARRALIDALAYAGRLEECYPLIRDASALHVHALQARLGLTEFSVPVLADLGKLSDFPTWNDTGLAGEALALGDVRGYVGITAAQLYAAWTLGLSANDLPVADALEQVESATNFEGPLFWFARAAKDVHMKRIDELLATSTANSEQTRVYRQAAHAIVALRRRKTGASAMARLAIEFARRCGAPMIAATIHEANGDASEALRGYRECGALGAIERLQAGVAQSLTSREREVAEHASGGASNRRIAEILSISERTVEHHIAAVLRKLNLKARDDIAPTLSHFPGQRSRDPARPAL